MGTILKGTFMGRRSRQGNRRNAQSAAGHRRLYGRHAVIAALGNPARDLRKLTGTAEELDRLHLPEGLQVQYADLADLDRLLPRDVPHQGLVLDTEPLPDLYLDDVLDDPRPESPLVILDQVTDPYNVGAIIRSAAAFGARAIITQSRHSPPESGALAKAASGALETLPWVRVVNLARALEEIAAAGYWRIGLAGEAEMTLAEALSTAPQAIVLGAEGDGLRANTRAHCDALARLPIASEVESLNVSNAAAVALYAVTSATKAG